VSANAIHIGTKPVDPEAACGPIAQPALRPRGVSTESLAASFPDGPEPASTESACAELGSITAASPICAPASRAQASAVDEHGTGGATSVPGGQQTLSPGTHAPLPGSALSVSGE
jgi:hypothetical protein